MPAEALSPRSSKSRGIPSHSARLSHLHRDGLKLAALEAWPTTDLHLTLTPRKGETMNELAHRLAEVLHVHEAVVVRLIAFGSTKEEAATLAALRQALEDPTLPVTWVEGASCTGGLIAGLQIHAVAGAKVHTINCGEVPVARAWDDPVASHCVLGGIGPRHPDADPGAQARETFEVLQASLAQANMAMKDVARTWFFLDGILDWYGEFNRVRNDFFARSELRSGSVPASTGVGGRNAAGQRVAAVAWAVRPHEVERRIVSFVGSPRQCPAPAYGSAFSRAVEIQARGAHQLLVSGTASIAPDGSTAHVGNLDAQIELSMEVVWSILDSRGMKFKDVSRATAYFKSAADAPHFLRWLERHKLGEMPVVMVTCEICRSDLLFEIELDAIQVR